MKDSIIRQCLDILKREDVKTELKLLITPIIDFIFYEMNPYIYIIIALIILLFIMILAILILLILLLRNKDVLVKIF